MDERMTRQFLLLTGEDENEPELWLPYCEIAAGVMATRLKGCTEEQKAPYGGAINLATAALAALYYEQAAAVLRPEKMTAGDLKLEHGGRSTTDFYRSCMEALAPLVGGNDGFCRVEA